MLTRVYLLRHAESADPTVFHGAESDVGLSERGQRQAATVAEVLASVRPQAVISSGMKRARDTAEPIAKACGLQLRLEPELHERRVGALSGMAFQSHDGIWPQTVERWTAGETSFAPPGAESFDDIGRRVLPVWHRLVDAFAGQTLVVVAHGIVCKVLLLSLLPEFSVRDWSRLGPIRNVAVSELAHVDQAWSAVSLNRQPALIVERGLE